MKNVALKALLGLAIAGAALALFYFAFKDTSLFAAKHVTVSGATGSRSERIKAAALGQSTLDFDDGPVRDAAQGKPPVRSLTVDVSPPHDVRITVLLYEPVAAVGPNAGALQAVAADGTVLPDVPVAGLPVVDGQAVAGHVTGGAALESFRVLSFAPPALRSRIRSFARDPKFGLYAVMANGTKIYFGDGSSATAKWAAASTVLAQAGAQGAAYVDVRVPRRPVVGGVSGGVTGGIDPADPNQPVGGDISTDTTDSSGN